MTVYTAVLEKMNSIGQLFFSHRLLLITNYRLSHLKIKMMGAKSPKTNFIAEKQKELEKLLVGYGAFRNLLLILDYNFIKTTTSFLKDACILVSFTVFYIQIDRTNTGFYIFNKNSVPDSLLKNILPFTAMVIKYREK